MTNWKDISPRVGVSFDVFGNGKTAVKASVARYVNGVGLAAGSITDNNNPETTVGMTDTRAWRDLDGNGSPFDSAGNIQLNELTNSTSTPSFGRNIASSTTTDPSVLERLGRRAATTGNTPSARQHELAPRVSVNGGWYRRSVRQPDASPSTTATASRTAATTVRSASTRRPIRICRAAAATRCAVSTI